MDQEARRPSPRLASCSRLGLIVGIAVVGLAASALIAVRRPVPTWELTLTDVINDAPDGIATVISPIMQLGSLGGPFVVSLGIGVFKRDWALSAATVVAGAVTWFSAKGIKRLVGRGRPLQLISDLVVREGDGSGLGYVSGHAAVAACTATMTMVALPPKWRPVAAGLVLVVGVARVIHGVHLPADVVGGWSFGVLMAIGSIAVLDIIERRAARR